MIGINLDLGAIIELKQELRPKIQQALQEAARDLAMQTHAHIVEEVQQKLHSSRDKYLAALHFEPVNDYTWVIGLDRKALWIEEGMEEHEMIDDLLKSPKAKTAKDGSRYTVVPFSHNEGPSRQTPAQQDLTSTIKSELKRRQIPFGKIERDADGKAKLGKLHSIDILKAPLKTKEGPGQGHGPVGQVRQGMTGTPFLQGIRIYQRAIKDQSTGKQQVKRSIVTFRVASSKQKGSGRWVHPGVEARNFMDKASDWAMSIWEQKIVPAIMARLNTL